MRSEGRLAKRQTYSRYGCSLQVRQLSHSQYGCATKVRKVSTNIWFLSPRKSPEPFLIDWYDFSDQVRLTGPWAIFVTAWLFPLRPECQALDFGLSFSSKIIKKFIFGKLEHKNHNQTSASKTLNNFELHASFVEADIKADQHCPSKITNKCQLSSSARVTLFAYY